MPVEHHGFPPGLTNPALPRKYNPMSSLQLLYDAGTLVVLNADDDVLQSLPGVQYDSRTNVHRAEGRHYRAIIESLRQNQRPYIDDARQYQALECKLNSTRTPFPHQKEALATWWNAGGRGVVALPTGTGKTLVALLAMAHVGRPTIVLTPTIPLMNQWYGELLRAFPAYREAMATDPASANPQAGAPIGLIGGGEYSIQPLTVTTYDSAYIHLERWGNRFGLIVFDECHHLPSASYQFAAVGAIAPYRLGLTATPERADGRDSLYPELVGPIVYRREIKQLAGDFLAEYRVVRVDVELTPAEKERYDQARANYRQFVRDRGISIGSMKGWQRFIQETCRHPEGRAAFQAYREQKRIALAAPAKINLLDDLLQRHALDRVIIFTYDNASVYEIARRFLVPAITHQTKTRERQQILERFHAGEFNVVVTSQVLNEGVDVPAASVGIILSGTGSVREHVQRLGRLLRKHGDKQALLYEVVT
ncbi:MAG TPA: DEAD/DEAH box helicase family protein, partial [Candidatus Cybelea sp.]|nr:DEAD/DEAH box helicase family protein [Candidatus Cybelea sp.]